MITRKSKSADLNSKRNLFFSIGLVLSLLLVITAFEWKFYDDGHLANINGDVSGLFEETFEIPPTEQPPPPPPKKTSFVNIVEVPDIEEIEEDINLNLDIDITEEMVVEEVEISVPDVEEEEAEEIFTIVEHNPQPIGGYEAFYTYMYSEIEYPREALRSGIEGKVFVQFVVNKNGELTNFVIVKGIGAGCDEETIRVLKKAPKWSAGRQRGKPVRVQMILPIKFTLAG